MPKNTSPNAQSTSGRRWASIHETAEYLRITTRTVRQMEADGRITVYRLSPRIVRCDLNEVDAMMRPEMPKAVLPVQFRQRQKK